MEGVSEFERMLLNEVDIDHMYQHLKWFNTIHRVSGTQDDWKSAEYVARCLREFGIHVDMYEFESLISHPIRASLRLVSPQQKEMYVKTRAFSGVSPAEGLVGEVVYVPTTSAGVGLLESVAGDEYSRLDVRGKIVLSERGGPDGVEDAQNAGAIGFIHLWPSGEDVVHDMTAGPVWGTPVPETAGRLPKIPAVAIRRHEGVMLRDLAAEGPVKVILRTEVDTRWRRLLLPVATIEGSEEPQLFGLIGGHLDSWYVGITDNATGNACCLELARILHRHRSQLRRSVKIAWWPGHSYGRYSGSTWFCDRFWEELHWRCLVYDNIDSPGVIGATDYAKVTAMAETKDLAEFVVREITGQETIGIRPQRAGDQSFWGAGVPSIFMLLSEVPKSEGAAVGGSGGAWWWHSEYDTLDKCDLDILRKDTQIHLLANLRILNSPVVPFRYGPMGAEFEELLTGYHERAGTRFDLGPALELAKEFRRLAERVDSLVDAARTRGDDGTDLATLNRRLMALSRICNPVLYTRTWQFEQEGAVPVPALPGLQPATQLAAMEPDSDHYRFTVTKLVRERTRTRYALRCAIDKAREILDMLE